ncbi:CBS domain containing-hemolysin-like protein [Laceyella sediminis]|uniref:CBS domain containing-hemolysin-like protein n=2 Tax=Laceyella sediminis TaxID=573074 RepID=A0ABX5ETP1_9BACL|nr:CBS domain containing-hemolysin-like protein [Laceyella sediminis]
MATDILTFLSQMAMILFLVLLNGFFVASEFAIVKVRHTRIAQLSEEGHHRAKTAQKILADLDAYLSATQLGITLASLGLGWIGEPYLAHLLTPALAWLGITKPLIHVVSFVLAFSIITFLHIVLGEMAPKSLAIRRAEATALWTAKPLHWFFVIFKPTIWLLNGAANLILKWIGVELVPDQQQAHTEEEIRMLVEQSHKSGIIDQTELSLFDNIFDFTNRIAREVMVPRVNMVCLYRDRSLEENLDIIQKSPFTRYPLCHKDKDDILGIIHIRDVYNDIVNQKVPVLTEVARPPVYVPEGMEIKDVLRTLQKHHTELAIIIDEFGGTAGLITIEDIVEEIVGEIQDEFDNEQPFFQQKGDETSISAQLLIEEVNEHFHIAIEDEDNDTIGGWFFSQLQEIPKTGSAIEAHGHRFSVQEMEGRRVTRILVKPLPPAAEPTASPED